MAQIGKKILYFFTAKTLVIYKETRFECDIDGNVIFRLQEMLHVRSSTVHVRESSSVICDFAPLEKRRHKGPERAPRGHHGGVDRVGGGQQGR